MSSPGSVTHWIEALKRGEMGAAQELWERYFERLVALARELLRGARWGAADEEDIALSAFDSFFRGVCRGRFPHLNDRDNLWRLLVVITARKAFDLLSHEQRQKRGGGRDQEAADVETLLAREPDPAFAAQMADECRRLLQVLGGDDLRTIALWKMEGYSNLEIAEKLGCARRTVERKLRLIRACWQNEGYS